MSSPGSSTTGRSGTSETASSSGRRPVSAEAEETKNDEILAFIADYWTRVGYPPSVRDIGAAVGLSSSSTVHVHLAELQRQGRIVKDPKIARSIRLVP